MQGAGSTGSTAGQSSRAMRVTSTGPLADPRRPTCTMSRWSTSGAARVSAVRERMAVGSKGVMTGVAFVQPMVDHDDASCANRLSRMSGSM